MRNCSIAALVVAVFAGAAVGIQACASTLPPAETAVGVPPPGVQTPLSPPASAVPPPPGAIATSPQAFELESFTPLLSMPELAAAAAAYATDDYAGAAAHVDAQIRARALDALDDARFHFLLATLYEKAGDLPRARGAFERAGVSAWPLADYAALGLGRCMLALGDLGGAELALGRVLPESAASASARGLMAEVACRKGDPRQCLEHAESYAKEPKKPAGWVAQSFRIGELLVSELATPRASPAAIENQLGALAFLRSLINRAPQTAERYDAANLEQKLIAALPEALRAERQLTTPAERLTRVQALGDANRHEAAASAAEAFLKELGQGAFGPIACQARMVHGKALLGMKQRQAAIAQLALAARHCKADDLRAWALYLAGKAAFQDGKYAEADRLLAQLERDLPRHRLADDGRLYRAQAQREMGVQARFSELLASMPDDYPEGDMTLDGVFSLALSRMEKSDWAGAATVLGRGVRLVGEKDVRRGPDHAGRERYFQARAMIETGDVERGLLQYEALILELPLSYYMLNAYSRLSERDSARAARALSLALDTSSGLAFQIERRPEFEQPGFLRAMELLRQSDIDSARRELELLDLLSSKTPPSVLWGIASLYARAGSARHSHALARWRLTDWVERWPAGQWRQAWELAFPRPHIETVTLEAQRQGIEPELVYAIMREESAFDAGAVSPANAYGLMQVISPTARRFGKEAGLPYDRRALTTPEVSIAIGSRVLSSYRGRFPEDPILAIPGYNAGPGRPKRWAKDWPSVDFDVWVELIPYRETRHYTKRVLASRAAYGYLYYATPEHDPLRLPRRLSAGSTNL